MLVAGMLGGASAMAVKTSSMIRSDREANAEETAKQRELEKEKRAQRRYPVALECGGKKPRHYQHHDE